MKPKRKHVFASIKKLRRASGKRINQARIERNTPKDINYIEGWTKEEHISFATVLTGLFVQGEDTALVRLKRGVLLPKGMTQGLAQKHLGDADYKVLLINIVKSLDWLHKHGYNEHSVEELKQTRREALLCFNEIERRLRNVGMD